MLYYFYWLRYDNFLAKICLPSEVLYTVEDIERKERNAA